MSFACFKVSLHVIIACDRHNLYSLIFYYFRYHPDKNANDPKAADMFKEVTFSYNILSDPDKRRQFDSAGFEVRITRIHLPSKCVPVTIELTISLFSS